jgi:hypothetical protein
MAHVRSLNEAEGRPREKMMSLSVISSGGKFEQRCGVAMKDNEQLQSLYLLFNDNRRLPV